MASNTRNAASAPLNEIVRTDGKNSPEGILPLAAKYAPHFIRDKNSYRSANFPDQIEFVDRKDRMHSYGKATPFKVRAMVETAAERGWEKMEVRGRNPVFKSMAWLEGTVRGITVDGHTPNDKDIQALERRHTRESAQANPAVQAYQNATTAADRKAAIKEFPALADAFAARAAGEKVIKGAVTSVDQQKELLATLDDKITRKIHNNEPMPQVQVRSEHRLQDVERE
ncbi:hypothetical protein J3A72_000423 [Stenotrophomonas sp. PvP093]|uniref:LPD7 domain-containing protein n=1 Tax=unclassified Stenotrophomonas TaxID=196198 RepID=UPI001AE5D511|nr:LPD7 domain-containing protein [Stenotrophomonas sp. PvP093]MBP2480131.1 hypothetical protein [Stenotrophomonas sp. PvP093]